MEYTIKTMVETTFWGVMTRLKRSDKTKISDFWQYFSQNNIFGRITNLLSPRIVVMYSNQNPENNECHFWLGGLVSEVNKTNELLKYKKIPEQVYAVFVSEGIPEKVLTQIWSSVEKSDLDRNYFSDFELYKPIGEGQFEIQVYVSLTSEQSNS
jgi:predicted transcriptional regulator YdeE